MSGWLYVACVNVMLNLADALGVTYRDVNVLILLVLFPALTLACLVACLVPRPR